MVNERVFLLLDPCDKCDIELPFTWTLDAHEEIRRRPADTGYTISVQLFPCDSPFHNTAKRGGRTLIDHPIGAAVGSFFRSLQLNLRLRVAVACRAALVVLPVRLAPWRYARGQRSLLVNFARATGAVASQAAGVSTAVAEEWGFGGRVWEGVRCRFGKKMERCQEASSSIASSKTTSKSAPGRALERFSVQEEEDEEDAPEEA